MRLDFLDYAFILLVGLYLGVAPYTKVEESFNIQAIHDILIYGVEDRSKYDHNEFPGVVPRTFVGALLLAVLTYPCKLLADNSGKFALQIYTRAILGIIGSLSSIYLRHCYEGFCLKSTTKSKASLSGKWYMVFSLVQFHTIFYASRTLPNMIALPFVNTCWMDVMKGRPYRAIGKLSFLALIFRIELVILAGATGLVLLISKTVTLWRGVLSGLVGIILGALISGSIDSIFWSEKFPFVPELHGLYFNLIEGKSSEWGVEPFWTYFLVHIPTLFNNPMAVLLCFQPFAGKLTDPVVRLNKTLLSISALYVTIYSLQPHKEWRFIIYVMPLLTLVAANNASTIQLKASKVSRAVLVLVALSTMAGLGSSLFKLFVSANNYPGGVALAEFHRLSSSSPSSTVHLDVPVCMSGASRFGQLWDINDPGVEGSHTGYIYDKTEDPKELAEVWDSFEYLVTFSTEALNVEDGYKWVPIGYAKGFTGLNLRYMKETGLKGLASREGLKDLFFQVVKLERVAFIYQKVPS